jgi:hypothetical protein
LTQYQDCVAKLALCANPDRLFEDVRGLLTQAGVTLSSRNYLLLRTGAALSVFALAVRALRVEEPRSTFLVSSLALAYLMLFNPRTLSSSYALTGAVSALLGAQYLLQRRYRLTVAILAIQLAWSINHHVVPWVEFWLRPLACVAFFAVLAYEIVYAPAPKNEDPQLM